MRGVAVSDDGFILTTPEQMQMWRLLSVRSMLRLEVTTGMRHSRGSVLKVAQREYGCKSRTKKGAIEELTALIDQRMGKAHAV
jgi:hypothetical protein